MFPIWSLLILDNIPGQPAQSLGLQPSQMTFYLSLKVLCLLEVITRHIQSFLCHVHIFHDISSMEGPIVFEFFILQEFYNIYVHITPMR